MPLRLFAGRVKDDKGRKQAPVEVPSDATPGVVKEPPPKPKAAKKK